MSKRKSSAVKKVKLYHKTGVRIAGVGLCTPDEPALVDEDMANDWLEANPNIWSKTPFAEKSEQVNQVNSDG